VSRTDFVEVGGQRYELQELERKRTVELRCDGCGEFLSEQEAVTVQGVQLIQWGAPMVYLPNLHFHPDHLPVAFRPFLTEGR
jgi:hypothetical protein